FFADEPILRVTAPLPEAQLVESRLLNLLHFQTLVASKAARAVLAAPGKLLVDFGMRRAHGAEAALLAARASYLAGLAGSATVLANLRFGIPVYGTMAHSFVQAHDDEAEAFAHFAADDPEHAVYLLDTYATEAAAACARTCSRSRTTRRRARPSSCPSCRPGGASAFPRRSPRPARTPPPSSGGFPSRSAASSPAPPTR